MSGGGGGKDFGLGVVVWVVKLAFDRVGAKVERRAKKRKQNKNEQEGKSKEKMNRKN